MLVGRALAECQKRSRASPTEIVLSFRPLNRGYTLSAKEVSASARYKGRLGEMNLECLMSGLFFRPTSPMAVRNHVSPLTSTGSVAVARELMRLGRLD